SLSIAKTKFEPGSRCQCERPSERLMSWKFGIDQFNALRSVRSISLDVFAVNDLEVRKIEKFTSVAQRPMSRNGKKRRKMAYIVKVDKVAFVDLHQIPLEEQRCKGVNERKNGLCFIELRNISPGV